MMLQHFKSKDFNPSRDAKIVANLIDYTLEKKIQWVETRRKGVRSNKQSFSADVNKDRIIVKASTQPKIEIRKSHTNRAVIVIEDMPSIDNLISLINKGNLIRKKRKYNKVNARKKRGLK